MKTKTSKIKSWLARLRRAPQFKIPGSARFTFQHAELVIRNFPIAFGKALQVGHK